MTNPNRSDDSRFAPASAPLVQGVADTGAPSEASTRTASFSHTIPSYPPGAVWADLRIVNELGRGGYGCVYRAWDNVLARDVALKIIRLQSSDPSSVSAVVQEGQMLAKVRHRNVVTIFGAQQAGDEFGLWMELVRGQSLSLMVRDGGPLGAEEASVIGLSLCDALAAVHGAGLLHRDVKAQNVMRESGGRIVLMDFGAGRELAIGHARGGEMAGTPLYISPEVLAGGPWTPAADVYSVGVLLFFLVTGKYPIQGGTLADIALAHALGQQRLLVDCRPGLPEGFVRVVHRTLACRYRTAGALMKDLAEAVAGGAGSWGDGGVPIERDPSMLATPVMANAPAGSGAAAPARLSVQQRVAIGASGLFGLWLLGFLTSVAFDQSLGRTGGFSDDNSVLDYLVYFVWGLRALFPLVSYMVLALIVARVVWGVSRLIGRVIPPVGRMVGAIRERIANGARIAGLTNRTTGAQWLLAGQLAAVVILWACFRDFIRAFGSVLDTAPPAALAQLGPGSDTMLYYRLVLAVVTFAMGLAWWRLLRTPPGGPPIDRLTTAAGLAATFMVLILATVPFRLVYQSAFQRADLAGERCYITGQQGTYLLLFCPGAPPRNRIKVVPAAEPTLHRMNGIESIFSPESSPGR